MSSPATSSLVLTDEIKALVNGALANGSPLLLVAVSPDGKPVASFRGSVQTYSDDQLGLWARNAEGGTLDAIRANPNVVLIYRSATTPVLQFHGRARIASDDAERKRVFESAPEREQAADPERKGAAVIVDLDRVEGVLRFGPNGPEFVRLKRG
jgi:Pyridoxamine 5'-phosphate oxidase